MGSIPREHTENQWFDCTLNTVALNISICQMHKMYKNLTHQTLPYNNNKKNDFVFEIFNNLS